MSFHETIGFTNPLLLIIIFILFILAFKKTLGIIKNAAIIVTASIIFPFAANLLGMQIASDVASIIYYITIGLGAYTIYLFGKSFYTFLSYAEKAGKDVVPA